MKIIIIGAGNVGIELARYLVDAGHAVTLVDNPGEALSQIASRIDLRVVQGNPSSPAVLRNAGAENTELLVAVTGDDETNITACCVGAFLFRIPRKIARIRSADYLQESEMLFGEGGIPIDHIISPEHLITEHILDLINLRGAGAVAGFFNGAAVVVSARCREGGKLVGQEIKKFEGFDGAASVLAVYRDGKKLTAHQSENFVPGDEVIFCCTRTRALSQLSALLPLSPGGRYVTISGGSHIADALAKQLSERFHIKLIEQNAERAARTAERLRDTEVEVYNADPASTDFMREEHLGSADLYIAATLSDETNIMSSLVLSRLHKVRTIAVIRGQGYSDLAQSAEEEIDTIISPNEATISALLSTVRQEGVENMRLFRRGRSEAIELKIEGSRLGSRVVGRKAVNLTLPDGVTLGLVWRERKFLRIDDNLVFEDGDHVIAYLDDHHSMRALVRLFRPLSFWLPKW